jgi:flagellar basal body-associated protein FliL
MALSDSKYKNSFITQDELDSLMNQAEIMPVVSEEGPGEPPILADETSDDAIITQDDIDALLDLGRSAMEKESGQESKEDDLVTQDDIDALLSNRPSSKKKSVPAPEPEPELDDVLSDLDLVTPDDIKKLLQAESFSMDETDDEQDEPLDSITDDDIKALLAGTDLTSDLQSTAKDDDDSVELITQDDIDALLAGVDKEEKKSRVKNREDDKPMPDMGTVDNLISRDDIDNLLNGTGESAGDSFGGSSESQSSTSEDNLISQEDIDKLLMGKYQEPEEEETTLIDQEDIDRLLSSARPFGEDRPARGPEPDKLISQDDIDRLLQEDEREKEKTDEDIHDQVILEKLDKLDIDERKPTKKVKGKGTEKKPLPKKKILVALAAACLILVVGAGSFYVYKIKFHSGKNVLPEVAEQHGIKENEHEASVGTGKRHGETAGEMLETISITMNDFVAVVPQAAKDSSYISLSLTFQIAETPENPVKEYEPFFRNIVYEVMNKALTSQGESAVAEADLKTMIMDALNGALNQGSVSVLEFIDFETG